MLKICLVFWKSEPQYAYKRYTYKKKCIIFSRHVLLSYNSISQVEVLIFSVSKGECYTPHKSVTHC